ncbi:MAG TPA: DUF2085 domain-containing protein [Pyrinomonadaceae bacterium]|nr:DUF2085 domain-containing protein [Pyrinomonadaceae bacterium]
MTLPAGNYVSIAAARTQAFKAWWVAVAVVTVWLLLIVLPPILAANGQTGISSPLYHFFSFICHQMPARSFHIFDHQLAVCSRCFGVYFGLLAGLIAYPLWRSIENIDPLPRIWLFASMVPIAIDWSLGVLDIWHNNHASRFITGMILGVACATYIMPALVEIVRNLSTRPASR